MHARNGQAGSNPPAFFDEFSHQYAAGMENPVKRWVGKSADDFIIPKVRWLLRDIANRPLPHHPTRILDHGCGTGLFLKHLRGAGLPISLHGCDTSSGMLDELRRTWDAGPLPELNHIESPALSYADGFFDMVVLSAVLHHVAPQARAGLLSETARVLAPRGRLYIFEHNPYHPMTRWVVRNTAIDREAVLVSSSQARRYCREAGLRDIRARHLLFLPPRWAWTRQIDPWLGLVPAGGQYALTADKPAASPNVPG
jgi:SAM-dependent methyltransferase